MAQLSINIDEIKYLKPNQTANSDDYSQIEFEIGNFDQEEKQNEISTKIKIYELKQQLIQDLDSLKQKNLILIQTSEELLKQIKLSLEIRIQKSLQCFQESIEKINYFTQQYIDKINNLPQDDQFKDKYIKMQKEFFKYFQIKEILIKQLGTIQIKQRIDAINQKLNQIEEGINSWAQDFINDYSQQLILKQKQEENISLICEPHKKKAIMVDLNKTSLIANRLACYDCIEQHPIKYKQIENFKQQWEKNQSEKKKLISNSIKELNKKEEDENDYIDGFKRRMINQVDDVKRYNNQEKVKCVDAINSSAQQLDKNFDELTLDQAIEFAEEISNPKNLSFQNQIEAQLTLCNSNTNQRVQDFFNQQQQFINYNRQKEINEFKNEFSISTRNQESKSNLLKLIFLYLFLLIKWIGCAVFLEQASFNQHQTINQNLFQIQDWMKNQNQTVQLNVQDLNKQIKKQEEELNFSNEKPELQELLEQIIEENDKQNKQNIIQQQTINQNLFQIQSWINNQTVKQQNDQELNNLIKKQQEELNKKKEELKKLEQKIQENDKQNEKNIKDLNIRIQNLDSDINLQKNSISKLQEDKEKLELELDSQTKKTQEMQNLILEKNKQFQELNLPILWLKPTLLKDDYWIKLFFILQKKTKKIIKSSNKIYQGSQNGLNAQSFWEEVIEKSNLLMIFQSKSNFIFGAYTPCKWEANKGSIYDDSYSSFIFSQDHDQVYPLRQKTSDQAIYSHTNFGPVFGGGNDIMIQANFKDGYSKLGKTFEFDQYQDGQQSSYLFGQMKPEIKECEVYQLQFI
ncbi:unnamed protein product [Paramecium sonneborni]|uniref:TLDc domain-containing protein n=1 Tax=Paramecium sonneborni TaxID=65129 RepID=A0A8S1RBK8_9CILI|nr:unnamed protein product [Paramecium sonneborni]